MSQKRGDDGPKGRGGRGEKIEIFVLFFARTRVKRGGQEKKLHEISCNFVLRRILTLGMNEC